MIYDQKRLVSAGCNAVRLRVGGEVTHLTTDGLIDVRVGDDGLWTVRHRSPFPGQPVLETVGREGAFMRSRTVYDEVPVPPPTRKVAAAILAPRTPDRLISKQ